MPLLNGVFHSHHAATDVDADGCGYHGFLVAMTEPTMLPLPSVRQAQSDVLDRHGKRETLRSIDCSSILNFMIAHERIALCAPPMVASCKAFRFLLSKDN